MMFLLPLLFGACLAQALVVDPVVTTDRSVNTYSIETIAQDVVRGAKTDEEKIVRLYSFQRRMLGHYRLHQYTEDNYLTSDAVRAYNVYGGSWCTQHATYFRQLCAQVFGKSNTWGISGTGRLPEGGTGGHSSFAVRFNEKDKWRWVDPVIGFWARNRTDGTIASMDEVAEDPLIFIDAVKEGRASDPFFPCAADKVKPCYYCYTYDTAFALDYSRNYKNNTQTEQNAYTTMKKTLQKGEAYYWLWDFLPGNYFLLSDNEADSGKRGWEWYPPRHFCNTDSLDTVNWPYFKPYKKTIKGKDCYRYYANGIHLFEPELGAKTGLEWRIKLPYPLLSMEISGEYVMKSPDDSLELFLAPLFFEVDSIPEDSAGDFPAAYLDTLNREPFRPLRAFKPALKPAKFNLDLRDMIDPVNYRTASKEYGSKIRKRWIVRSDSNQVVYKRTYQGYILKVVMKANAGLNRIRVKSIFQHNMFALPQLMPGPNRVTVTVANPLLEKEKLKVGFGWVDQDRERRFTAPIFRSGDSHILTVKQAEIPRMLFMWLGNVEKEPILR